MVGNTLPWYIRHKHLLSNELFPCSITMLKSVQVTLQKPSPWKIETLQILKFTYHSDKTGFQQGVWPYFKLDVPSCSIPLPSKLRSGCGQMKPVRPSDKPFLGVPEDKGHSSLLTWHCVFNITAVSLTVIHYDIKLISTWYKKTDYEESSMNYLFLSNFCSPFFHISSDAFKKATIMQCQWHDGSFCFFMASSLPPTLCVAINLWRKILFLFNNIRPMLPMIHTLFLLDFCSLFELPVPILTPVTKLIMEYGIQNDGIAQCY